MWCGSYETNLKQYQNNKTGIINILNKSGLNYRINGEQNFAIPNTINISFTGINSEALMLSTRHFCSISNGSACNSNSYKPSHVLTAMGLDIDRIQSAIRISWGIEDVIPSFKLLTDKAKDFCIESSYNKEFGARPIKRFITKNIETLIAEKLLKETIHEGDNPLIDYNDDKFTIKIK